MLHVRGYPRPGMPSRLVDGHLRRRERGISERAHRNSDRLGYLVQQVIHRRAALRAEVERDGITTLRGADVLRGTALDADLVPRKPRLSAEHAPRPPLAREAMAHRDPDGLALGGEGELSAAARGTLNRHGILRLAQGA